PAAYAAAAKSASPLRSVGATGCAPQGKPKFTEPCNHCGICCTLQLCEFAEEVFDTDPPCPALLEGKCGLVRAESMLLNDNTLAKALGIGCGCSMPDADTTDEEIESFDILSHQKVFGA
ncbi:MAG: hypothetical protein OEL55_04415, partial [Desulfobulbaceae bacterium]|nr:hypothetical protein [Desulfobulbaceae bacterium]